MQTQTEPNATSIMAGLLTRKQTAAEMNCTERTIIWREHAGMPVIRVGMLRLYNPAAVRDWLLTHEARHDTPKRGRPSKGRAA